MVDETKRIQAAEQWNSTKSFLYALLVLICLFGVHVLFFYVVGTLAASLAERSYLTFMHSQQLVVLGLILFIVIGVVYFFAEFWFWLISILMSYLVFFELDNSSTVYAKQKTD